MYGANVIIFEGILAFYCPNVLKVCIKFIFEKQVISLKVLLELHNIFETFQLLDMKVFVDTDSDERLVRRLRRDIQDRGRDLDGVLKQYFKFVKPAFDYYIAPSMVSLKLI